LSKKRRGGVVPPVAYHVQACGCGMVMIVADDHRRNHNLLGTEDRAGCSGAANGPVRTTRGSRRREGRCTGPGVGQIAVKIPGQSPHYYLTEPVRPTDWIARRGSVRRKGYGGDPVGGRRSRRCCRVRRATPAGTERHAGKADERRRLTRAHYHGEPARTQRGL